MWLRQVSLRPTVRRWAGCGAVGAIALACAAPGVAHGGTDGRVYEMVSPPDKNGYPVFQSPQQGIGLSALSADGNRAVFSSYGSFADSRTGMPASYLAARSGDGKWLTRVASPPPGKPMPNVVTGDASNWLDTNPDLSYGVTITYDMLVPEDTDPFTGDIYRVGVGQAPELLSQGNNGEFNRGFEAAEYAGVSADGSKVLFRARAHLVPGDASRTDGSDLYVREDGLTALVSQRAGGTSAGNCGAILGSVSPFGGSRQNAISADGTRIVFTTPDPMGLSDPDCALPSHVYLHDSGSTVDVSASQRAVPDPGGPAPAVYAGSASDGSRIIFRSTEMLTDDAQPGGGIYSYDVLTRRLRVLVSSPDVTVLRISDDARLIYFLSTSDLTPGNGSPVTLKFFVYREDDRAVSFILEDATYLLDISSWPMAVNSKGDLAFATTTQISSFDNRTFAEVYLFQQGTSRLVCVSCDPAGQRPATSLPSSNANIIPPRGGYSVDARPSFSADGARLVFESGDRLISEDTNKRVDVYEFTDGEVRLVSSGRSDQDSYVVGISTDGNTVMFATYESLVPQDRDGGNQDMYVGRFDGVPSVEQEENELECSGDACQGPVTPPPAAPIAGSEVLDVSGNSEAGQQVKLSLTSLSLPRGRALRTVARTGRLPLTILTRGAGRIGVQVTTMSRGRTVIVGSASKTIKTQGTARTALSVALTRAARRIIASRGRIRLTVRAVLNGKATGTARSLVLVAGSRGAAKR